jgi:anti-anti-sigma factor
VKIDSVSGDITIFSVCPEPDLGLEIQAITEMVSKEVNSNVIVDFLRVDIVRSSSLTKLLKLRQVLINRNRQVVLCGVQPLTQSIMEVTDLNKVFAIVPDKEAAMAAIQSKRLAEILKS